MSWLRWRPMTPVAGLSRGTPHARWAGGEALALAWLQGRWVALRDRCPHRGAPLSQGARVGGWWPGAPASLRCPYHGWRFGAEGQLLDACGHRPPLGAQAASYPVVEAGALLWAAVGPSGASPLELPAPEGMDPAELRPLAPAGAGLPKGVRPGQAWSVLWPADQLRTALLAEPGWSELAPDLLLGPGPEGALALIPLGPGATDLLALVQEGNLVQAWSEPPWWGALAAGWWREGPGDAKAMGSGDGWRLDR